MIPPPTDCRTLGTRTAATATCARLRRRAGDTTGRRGRSASGPVAGRYETDTSAHHTPCPVPDSCRAARADPDALRRSARGGTSRAANVGDEVGEGNQYRDASEYHHLDPLHLAVVFTHHILL